MGSVTRGWRLLQRFCSRWKGWLGVSIVPHCSTPPLWCKVRYSMSLKSFLFLLHIGLPWTDYTILAISFLTIVTVKLSQDNYQAVSGLRALSHWHASTPSHHHADTLLECHGSGLIFTGQQEWRVPQLNSYVAELIEKQLDSPFKNIRSRLGR